MSGSNRSSRIVDFNSQGRGEHERGRCRGRNVAVVEEEVNDMSGSEEDEYNEVAIPINYIVQMAMELLFLNLRYMIKFNINHLPDINRL